MRNTVSEDMIRKALTIFSLIGLLLSAGPWGLSYFDISYTWRASVTDRSDKVTMWSLTYGAFSSSQVTGLLASGYREGFRIGGFADFETEWSPSLSPFVWSPNMVLPFWIPTLLCGAWTGWQLLPSLRRRRRKLGLCVKCGYNLKGLTELRCPECNTPFEKCSARL